MKAVNTVEKMMLTPRATFERRDQGLLQGPLSCMRGFQREERRPESLISPDLAAPTLEGLALLSLISVGRITEIPWYR